MGVSSVPRARGVRCLVLGMPDKLQKVIINIGGGYATDFGPSFTGAPQGNALTLPFLLRADNIIYELDGAPHKVGGSTLLNTNRVSEGGAGVAFMGIYDYWRQGTAGTETQQRIAYVGTQIMTEPMTGVWTSQLTGLELSKEPCFETFNDNCILATNSTVDVPQTWNGTAISNLGGLPPKFAFHTKHKNRLWASGNVAFPSRLYYSNSLDATDWAGGGSIDIDPSDGDRITGIRSHKNELIVFKGPNQLSIHRITGSSPSGSDAFARVPFVHGVGSINHNGIFAINDDVVFSSPRGIHSLAATAAFGDYVEAFLSRPILGFYQNSLNHTVLTQNWGVNYQTKGLAIWTFALAVGSTKNVCLVYDYRFQPGRWATWGFNSSYVNCNCLAVLQITGRKHRLFAGTTDGYVHQLDVADRSIATATAYTGDVLTPFLNFGTSAVKKNAHKGYWSLLPKGNYNFNFEYTRDNNAAQAVTVAQSGGDVLG